MKNQDFQKEIKNLLKKQKKRETYGVESTSRAGGAREAPGVRLRRLAL
jgi:hypothetical protein